MVPRLRCSRNSPGPGRPGLAGREHNSSSYNIEELFFYFFLLDLSSDEVSVLPEERGGVGESGPGGVGGGGGPGQVQGQVPHTPHVDEDVAVEGHRVRHQGQVQGGGGQVLGRRSAKLFKLLKILLF